MKRVKKKNKGPANPLFEKWLSEWQQKAAKDDNPTQWGFQKALSSLKKYPLRMETGKDCAVLNGFGPKICKMLDKKLEEYRREKLESGTVDSDDPDSEEPAAKANRDNNGDRNPKRQKKQKQPKEKPPWMPKKGEGAHALLVTLYKNLTENGQDRMLKEELMDQAQKICDTPMRGNARNHYGAWSAMSNLRKKEFCKSDEKKPAKYSLTDKGVALASVLNEAMDNGGASISSVMPPTNGFPPLNLGSDSDSDYDVDMLKNLPPKFVEPNGIDLGDDDEFPPYDPESFNFGPPNDSPKKSQDIKIGDDGFEVYDPKVWDSLGAPNNPSSPKDLECGEDGFQIYDPSKFEDVAIPNRELKKEIEVDFTQGSSYIDFSKQVNVSTSYIDDFDRSWRQRETLQSTPVANKSKSRLKNLTKETEFSPKSSTLVNEDVPEPHATAKSSKPETQAKSPRIFDDDIYKPSTSGMSSAVKKRPTFLDDDIYKPSTSAGRTPAYLNDNPDYSDEDSLPKCNVDFRQKVPLTISASVDLTADSPPSSPEMIKTVIEQNEPKKSFDDDEVIELLSDDEFQEEKKDDNSLRAMAMFEEMLKSTPEKPAPKSNHIDDDEIFLDLCKENGTSELHPSSKKSPNYMEAISGLDRAVNVQQARKNLDNDLNVEESDENLITFGKHDFDVILLIDNGETSGNKDRRQYNFDISQEKTGILYERRSLKVGDFTWIARCRHTKQELVLPYIIERKSTEDLAKSIKDNRFHEQKFRLKRCGIKNVIYLIEKPESKYIGGIPLSALSQAAVNTSVRDNFSVKYTNCHRETVQYLGIMTKILEKKFKGKDLVGTTTVRPGSDKCIEFSAFNKFSAKTKNFTVKDMFIRQLMQLSRVSADVAKEIVNLYPTPRCLAEAYDRNGGEGENLLKDVQYGNLSKRRIGAAISKTLYQLYTKKDFS